MAAAVAVLVTAGVAFEIAGAAGPLPWPPAGYLLAVGASAAVLYCRRLPLLVGVVIVGLVAAYHFAGYPGGAPALALFAVVYFIAATDPPIRTFLTAVGVIAVWEFLFSLPPSNVPWYSFAITGPAAGMLAFAVLGANAGKVHRLHRRALETEQAVMRDRLTAERLGIARELHDVLAHTVSAISVHSALALDVFDDDPEAARAAITRVRALAQQAMPELRRSLQLVRDDAGAARPARPQPGLAQIGALVEQARAAGLRVDADLAVPDDGPGAFVQLTAYRIVQEALTNVIRHAHATRIVLAVRRDGDDLTITVADDGCGSPQEVTPRLGLIGMRERARAAGGTVTASTA